MPPLHIRSCQNSNNVARWLWAGSPAKPVVSRHLGDEPACPRTSMGRAVFVGRGWAHRGRSDPLLQLLDPETTPLLFLYFPRFHDETSLQFLNLKNPRNADERTCRTSWAWQTAILQTMREGMQEISLAMPTGNGQKGPSLCEALVYSFFLS